MIQEKTEAPSAFLRYGTPSFQKLLDKLQVEVVNLRKTCDVRITFNDGGVRRAVMIEELEEGHFREIELLGSL